MKQSIDLVKDILNKNNISFDSLSEDMLSNLYSEFINSIMVAERRNYLNNNSDEYANGYRPKNLQTAGDNIDIQVPRTRTVFSSWVFSFFIYLSCQERILDRIK